MNESNFLRYLWDAKWFQLWLDCKERGIEPVKGVRLRPRNWNGIPPGYPVNDMMYDYMHTYVREQFNPELLKNFSERDIPTFITAKAGFKKGTKYNTTFSTKYKENENGRVLHTDYELPLKSFLNQQEPSLYFNRVILGWGDYYTEDDRSEQDSRDCPYVVPHREDGPALIWLNGFRMWHKDGKPFRRRGNPVNGLKTAFYWYHRDYTHPKRLGNGPALIHSTRVAIANFGIPSWTPHSDSTWSKFQIRKTLGEWFYNEKDILPSDSIDATDLLQKIDDALKDEE